MRWHVDELLKHMQVQETFRLLVCSFLSSPTALFTDPLLRGADGAEAAKNFQEIVFNSAAQSSAEICSFLCPSRVTTSPSCTSGMALHVQHQLIHWNRSDLWHPPPRTNTVILLERLRGTHHVTNADNGEAEFLFSEIDDRNPRQSGVELFTWVIRALTCRAGLRLITDWNGQLGRGHR